MVVQSLGGQHLCQLSLLSRALLQLRPLVLEPDLDLVLVQAQLVGQVLAPLFREVSVVFKLLLEAAQLVGGECRAGALLALVNAFSRRLLNFSRART